MLIFLLLYCYFAWFGVRGCYLFILFDWDKTVQCQKEKRPVSLELNTASLEDRRGVASACWQAGGWMGEPRTPWLGWEALPSSGNGPNVQDFMEFSYQLQCFLSHNPGSYSWIPLSLPFRFLLHSFLLSLEFIFLLLPRYLQPNLPRRCKSLPPSVLSLALHNNPFTIAARIRFPKCKSDHIASVPWHTPRPSSPSYITFPFFSAFQLIALQSLNLSCSSSLSVWNASQHADSRLQIDVHHYFLGSYEPSTHNTP